MHNGAAPEMSIDGEFRGVSRAKGAAQRSRAIGCGFAKAAIGHCCAPHGVIRRSIAQPIRLNPRRYLARPSRQMWWLKGQNHGDKKQAWCQRGIYVIVPVEKFG